VAAAAFTWRFDLRRSRDTKSFKATLLVLLVAAVVSGCGRRGRLEAPPDPNAPPVDAASTSRAGVHKRAPNRPFRAPDAPFVLDPLLQ